MTDRAVAPVVGKALEAGIVLVYVSLVAGVLYGSVVPGYRTAAGEELGDRALAEAAAAVEDAVPRAGEDATTTARVDLPDSIRGASYVVRAGNRSLVLDHPHPAVGGRHRLALPDRVVAVRGNATSDGRSVVRVNQTDGGLVVVLDDP